jgi:hypothetical protein
MVARLMGASSRSARMAPGAHYAQVRRRCRLPDVRACSEARLPDQEAG